MVVGDAATLHVKGAVHDVYAAAPAVAVRACAVAGDTAAVHGEGAAVDKHAAAVLRYLIIGDGAVVQGDLAAVDYMDAAGAGGRILADDGASLNKGLRTTACHIQAGASVVGDGTALHGKSAAGYVHHAAAMAGVVAGNSAALHLKGAASHGDGGAKAPRIGGFGSDFSSGDAAIAAVLQGQGAAAVHRYDAAAAVTPQGMAVQINGGGDAAAHREIVGQCDIICQDVCAVVGQGTVIGEGALPSLHRQCPRRQQARQQGRAQQARQPSSDRFHLSVPPF